MLAPFGQTAFDDGAEPLGDALAVGVRPDDRCVLMPAGDVLKVVPLEGRVSSEEMVEGGTRYDVFLSYKRRAHGPAGEVARALRKSGLTVFLDRCYLAAGGIWAQPHPTTLPKGVFQSQRGETR